MKALRPYLIGILFCAAVAALAVVDVNFAVDLDRPIVATR